MLIDIREQLRVVRWGLMLSILAIFAGFSLGGAFGAAEDSLQQFLHAQGEGVLATVYNGDTAQLDATVSKAWNYFLRAHMHAGGIGAAALSLNLLLAFLNTPIITRKLCSLALGVGALGYPLFWLLAGIMAPGLGSTGAAKDSLEWLAVPSAGCLLLGVLGTLILSGMTLFRRERL